MKTLMPVFLLAAALLLAAESPAAAQVPFAQARSFSFSGRSGGIGTVRGQPTFSPYLNLFRSDNSFVLNYYGLVRPELEFREANQQFQSSLGMVRSEFQQQLDMPSELELPESGHHVQFQSNLRGPVRNSFDRPGAASGRRSLLSPTGHGVSFGHSGSWFPSATANRNQQ